MIYSAGIVKEKCINEHLSNKQQASIFLAYWIIRLT